MADGSSWRRSAFGSSDDSSSSSSSSTSSSLSGAYGDAAAADPVTGRATDAEPRGPSGAYGDAAAADRSGRSTDAGGASRRRGGSSRDRDRERVTPAEARRRIREAVDGEAGGDTDATDSIDVEGDSVDATSSIDVDAIGDAAAADPVTGRATDAEPRGPSGAYGDVNVPRPTPRTDDAVESIETFMPGAGTGDGEAPTSDPRLETTAPAPARYEPEGIDADVRDLTGGPEGAFGEEGISPSVGMALDDPEAREARAEKEQDILDQRVPESVGDVPAAVGASLFGAGQQLERTGVELGAAARNIFGAEAGPQIREARLGEVPGVAAELAVAGPFVGAGAAAQLPASTAADWDARLEGDEAPTDIQGGADTVRSFGETQVEMATDYPVATGLTLLAPVGPRAFRGVERGLGDAGVTTPRRPTVQRLDVGETSGVTVGTTRQRGRVTETDPVASVLRDPAEGTRVETGTPEVPLEGIFGEGATVSQEMSAAETSIFAESLRAADRPTEATKIESFREVQAETQRSDLRPERAEDVVGDVLESQDVPREAAGEVTDLIAAEEAQLYGSIVQRAATDTLPGEPGLARTPRDLDVGGLESTTEFARQATERINEAAGERVVERQGEAVRSRSTGEELFDLHAADEAAPEGSPSPFAPERNLWGVREDSPVRTAEGVETTTLAEQTRRKGEGATALIERGPGTTGAAEGMIRPLHEGRVKDIPDFYIGEQANIARLREQGRTESARRAETELESFVEAFGEDMAQRARSEYRQALEGERAAPRTQLADFGEGARSSPGLFGESPSPSPGTAAGAAGTSSPLPGAAEVGSPSSFASVDTGSPGVAPGSLVDDISSPPPSEPVDASSGPFGPIGDGASTSPGPSEPPERSPPPSSPVESPVSSSPFGGFGDPSGVFGAPSPIDSDVPPYDPPSSPPSSPGPSTPPSSPPHDSPASPGPSEPPYSPGGSDPTNPPDRPAWDDEKFDPHTPGYTNPVAGVFDDAPGLFGGEPVETAAEKPGLPGSNPWGSVAETGFLAGEGASDAGGVEGRGAALFELF